MSNDILEKDCYWNHLDSDTIVIQMHTKDMHKVVHLDISNPYLGVHFPPQVQEAITRAQFERAALRLYEKFWTEGETT